MKKINREILEKVVPELNKISFVYDSMKTLWTSEELLNPVNHSILKGELPPSIAKTLHGTGQLDISISRNKEKPSIKLSDFSLYKNKDYWKEEDHSLRNLLELITSEHALRKGFCHINGKLFGPEEPFKNGLIVRLGCQKGAQFIQELSSEKENQPTRNSSPQKEVQANRVNRKKGRQYYRGRTKKEVDSVHDPSESNVNPILCIDSTKKVFYPEGQFSEIYKNAMANSKFPRDVSRIFRGVKLRSKTTDGRIFTFKEFGQSVENITSFDISKYHQEQYNITLKNLKEPTAIMKDTNGNFPLEVLEILPDQIVPLSNLSPFLKKKQKELNIVKSEIRYRNIMKVVEKLELQNPITKAFKITVKEEMMKVKYEILKKPIIEASRVIHPDEKNGTFKYEKNTNFLIPAEIENWGVVYEKKLEIKELVQKIQNTLQSFGVKIQDPKKIHVESTNMEVNGWINTLEGHKLKLVLVVDEHESTHGNLKLAETSIPGLVTQHLTFKVAEDITKGKRETCTNLCFKINIKNGGLNYKVVMDDLE